MDKETLKKLFEAEREKANEYILKDLQDKPLQEGIYTISIDNFKTIVPLKLKFNGIEWESQGLQEVMEIAQDNKIFYYDKEVKNINKKRM